MLKILAGRAVRVIPKAIYQRLCPHCGGAIDSERLALGLPCRECLPEYEGPLDPVSVANALKRLEQQKQLERRPNEDKSRGYERVLDMHTNYQELDSMFRRAVGFPMWGAQRFWARRAVKNKSFSIVAPTGSGKTTFGVVLSLYKASKGGKVLFVLPTSTLAMQVYERAVKYAQRLGLDVRVVTYNSLLGEAEKREALEKISSGDFDVVVVTSMFLPRHFDVLSRHRFNLVFADDVDSMLKATSKNIDRVLKLLGVTDTAMSLALEIVNLTRQWTRLVRIGDEEAAEEVAKRIRELRDRLNDEKERMDRHVKVGTFIAAGALAKARRTARLLLFREFLGFDVGGRAEGLRNIVDAYVAPDKADDATKVVVDIVTRIGGGGIVYVPTDMGREFALRLSEALNGAGVRSEAFLKPKRGVLERFSNGELDVLVGLATARSPLVRGIDLPHVIRYVVFAGIPKFRFRLRMDEFNPSAVMTFLYNVRAVLDRDRRLRVDRAIAQLRNIVGHPKIGDLLSRVAAGERLTGFDKYVVDVVSRTVRLVRDLVSDEELVDRINREPGITVRLEGGEAWIVVPDITTYIQGSGRASRLYAGGLTRGLSVVVVDDAKVFEGLKRELRLRFEEASFTELSGLDLGRLLAEIDEDRKKVRKVLEGTFEEGELEARELMRTRLIVVESPTKARTIATFYGRPSRQIVGRLNVYEVSTGDSITLVVASMGHVVDLQNNLADTERLKSVVGEPDGRFENRYAVLKTPRGFIPVYNTIKRCGSKTETDDMENCPDTGSRPLDSKDIIEALRDISMEVDEVYVGTDPDAEGEKIGWDITLFLRPYVPNIRRIEFHEVTRRAVMNAVANPRSVNYAMVKAQLVRRIEDRWIGFGLSNVLQRAFNTKWRPSAGRVQTPVLGWVVESYVEAQRGHRYMLMFVSDGVSMPFELPGDVNALRAVKRLANEGKLAVEVSRTGVEKVSVAPPPPYTTDALLRDASQRLRIGVDRAMQIAQDLFELGLITYHRTDSTRVSAVGIGVAREYVARRFGEAKFRARTWEHGEAGAHEAIRPTRPMDVEELRGLINAGVIQAVVRPTPLHYAMYDMIFRRFIASQMREAVVVRATYRVKALDQETTVERVVSVEESGFLEAYPIIEVESELPEGVHRVRQVEVLGRMPWTRLRTQSDLIQMMRERGIGRPSTYSKIVQVLMQRRYVKPVGRFMSMMPTKMGLRVYTFLNEERSPSGLHYRELVSEERTRLVERLMDEVERGHRDYIEVLQELHDEVASYGLF